MLVIGSVAAKILGYYDEEVKDIDVVATYEESQAFIRATKPVTCYPLSKDVLFLKWRDGTIGEIEIAWPGSRGERLLDAVKSLGADIGEKHWVRGFLMDVPCLDMLYLLKMSHRYLKNSPHFLKTMQDIHRMREQGAAIPENWMPFFKSREADTYVYKHPKLNVDKSEFFDQVATGVRYTWDHDSIHRVVALQDKPAYTNYMVEDAQVLCSSRKFEECSFTTRINGVVEEAMVLAVERSLVPFPGKKTPEEAFLMALMKVCTSITSGWFREFAWEHYNEAVEVFHAEQARWCFFQKFTEGVAAGLVKPNKG